ncbi:SDR family NAD(P)-dependent oxidoreductase [Nonomuraea endophytica]|uniref:NAD(P)-dependent dehydrogenase (Short-subunit alcohol dehydrogenase family) n=1 Tax=Nonomuraea endophytica TaxID=714136 RepID=A0A7W8A983_9ACTN|nr:SDR family NAD(P)-dependent oxidoreductase [Nonomuraea endophytica]MBB5081900.1 NAD(P)-dependent dehydrogenase (short-subunit alcohol dehydrogenase family) [Nonomuraea endophytica]
MDIATALVTGASRGIGKEIARELARQGLTVYVTARSAESAAAVAAEIGGDARPLRLDVTDPDSVAAAASQVEVLDVLVNNAGVAGDPTPAQDEDLDTFRRIYETNVFGPVTVTNALVPTLRRSAHPRIVNISSGSASLTWATGPMAKFNGVSASYRSSKAALNALTVLYAQSLADDGIKVNAFAPGFTRTDLNSATSAAGGAPDQAAVAAVRLALLPDDGPTGTFVNWEGTTVPW